MLWALLRCSHFGFRGPALAASGAGVMRPPGKGLLHATGCHGLQSWESVGVNICAGAVVPLTSAAGVRQPDKLRSASGCWAAIALSIEMQPLAHLRPWLPPLALTPRFSFGPSASTASTYARPCHRAIAPLLITFPSHQVMVSSCCRTCSKAGDM